jgi:hypothetical protein
MLSVIMLSILVLVLECWGSDCYCYAECHYAEHFCAGCYNAEDRIFIVMLGVNTLNILMLVIRMLRITYFIVMLRIMMLCDFVLSTAESCSWLCINKFLWTRFFILANEKCIKWCWQKWHKSCLWWIVPTTSTFKFLKSAKKFKKLQI